MRRRPTRYCCHPECRLRAAAACLPWQRLRRKGSGADDVEGREAALERAGGVRAPPPLEHGGIETAKTHRERQVPVPSRSEIAAVN